MSREQRRVDRKTQKRGASPVSRKTTPVRAGGTGPPWLPIGIAVGAVAIIALLVYVILARGSTSTSAAQKAANDQSSSIPGTYVPDQGRTHLSYSFSISSQRTPIPFCPGVVHNEANNPGGASTTPGAGTTPTTAPAATSTPQPTSTPAATTTTQSGTSVNRTPDVTPTVRSDCYLSNPPSSGTHYNVQHNVDVGNGAQIDIPAGTSVYPPTVEIPRSSIPHILEHAGVYVGWNCAEGDQACLDVEKQLEQVVNDRIDINKNRVVMAHDSDLVPGTIGLSSWTRVLDLNYTDYKKQTVADFIGTNSCRVDWESFCK